MRKLIPFTFAVFAGAELSAQTAAGFDVSGARISYADGGSLSAGSVGPFIQLLAPNGALAASGAYSVFDAGGWSAQGFLSGSVLTPAYRFARGELLANLDGSTHQDGTRTSQLRALGRLHFQSARRGVWLGGGGGTASDGVTSRGIVFGNLGAWLEAGPTVVRVTVAPTRLRDDVRFTDSEGSLSWFGERSDLYLVAGGRAIAGGGTAWGSASGTYWILPSIGFVASAGKYPSDLAQTLPGGSYVSIGMRLMKRSPASVEEPLAVSSTVAAPHPARAIGVGSSPDAARPDFELAPTADGARRLRFRIEASRSVELMGDFTQWKPVSLERVDRETWELIATIPTGLHQVNVRADGGPWIVPFGLTSVSDEFGGAVGILIVP